MFTGECQPEFVTPLTSGEGFRHGITVTTELHDMLLQHLMSGRALAENGSRDWWKDLPGENYMDIVRPAADGKPRTRVVFLSPAQKQEVVEIVQPLVESWVGQKLRPSSVYGVRLCVLQTAR